MHKASAKQCVVRVLIALVRTYRRILSPCIGARCRFYPTCSTYAIHALHWHGVQGVVLVIRRLMRCQPWGGHGVDFVPLPLCRWRYLPAQKLSTEWAQLAPFVDNYSYRVCLNQMLSRTR